MRNISRERRRIRSEDRDIAVEMQLSHVVDVLNLDALVLANDMGRALSRLGDSEVGELLAAMVMWTGFSSDVDEFTVEAIQERDPTVEKRHIRSVTIDLPERDGQLQLVALGRSIVTSIGLAHAAAGIRRIHAKRH